MKILKIVVAVMTLAFAGPLSWTTVHADDAHHTSQMADAEVKKVDKSAGKVTLKHGPLKNLDMPAMTMVFRVKDPAMLDQLKAGDKIKFLAEKEGGAYVIAKFERVQ